ncbi:multidrug transporter [Fructilactobacillus lindneri]|uniref:MFS-type transporter YcnB n=2 Tax=Fructilactobacillus lindneri TaxID=53444 RepID=A0A0R2JW85_9LACO|nr:MDR family MFS transporter [Fructilactobacillus lindneri]ANZ57367.1 multidrug transporter [Fructilactobacillus lindneri]ANZ58632.1 multidrug transporter [Fructilactobacillus lindneri]KRN79974.1 MFS-type transporter YcnB [Fructilactobacillus lindneri DSM 20690 = JCM 11027]POG97852.1 multidrug transporter [Fructilactobacillus lindneri]POG99184.1 multidrug transporter [Fructilactobacillus lindneri]
MSEKQTVDAKGKPYNRTIFVLLLLVGAFVAVLNQTILGTAFPTLMHAFHVSTSTVQWLTTGFMMVNGILIPVSAWLAERVNTKWLYLGAMLIFEIGTIMAYVAPTFQVLFVARLVQAVGVGVIIPLMQTILLSIFPAEERGAALGMGGIVIGLAPAIGPTLSGWVIDNYNWRDLFGILIPIAAIVLILGLFYIKPVLKTHKSKLDYLSLVLSTIGFGSALYGFSSVGNDGWGSATVIWSLIIGAIFIILFIWRQLTMKDPFLNLSVFKSFKFSISTAIASVAFMAMIGVEMVLPLYLQIVKGLSAFHSGLALLGGALMMGLMSPITGILFDKFGAKRLAIGGLFLLSVGTFPFMFLTKDTSTAYIVVLYAVRMFGIAMVMMPVTTAGMNSLSVKMMGHGTAVNNTVRQICGSIATSIMVSILSNVTSNNMPSHMMRINNPLHYRDLAINATLKGYTATFGIAFIISVIAFLIAFALKNGRVLDTKKAKGGNE